MSEAVRQRRAAALGPRSGQSEWSGCLVPPLEASPGRALRYSSPESSKRVLHGEAVFCFELRRFGVNRPRERAMGAGLGVLPRFFRTNDAILALSAPGLHCLPAQDRVRPRPDSPTLWWCSALPG